MLLYPLFLLGNVGVATGEVEIESTRRHHIPKPCVWGHPTEKHSGNTWSVPVVQVCPEGTAAMSARVRHGPHFISAEEAPLSIECCPLPATDILTNEHIEASAECPADYIITGAQAYCLGPDFSEPCNKPIRCTRINKERYQLNSEASGAMWGISSVFYMEKLHYMKSEIPLALRYALGRLSRYSWQAAGCIGFPFGSLLVKKISGKRCHHLFYRELQYSGVSGDPPKGTPVKMLPNCTRVSGVFSNNPLCNSNDLQRTGSNDK